MSISALNRVWDASEQSGGKLLIMLALADYADEHNRAWPSVDTLARKARMSKRNAQLCLRQLEEEGEIATLTNQGPNGCNVYVISVGGEKSSPVKNGASGGEICDEGGEDCDRGGEICDTQGVKPASPEPSRNHQEQQPPKEPSEEAVDARGHETPVATTDAAQEAPNRVDDGHDDTDPAQVEALYGTLCGMMRQHPEMGPPKVLIHVEELAEELAGRGVPVDVVLEADERWWNAMRARYRRAGRDPSEINPPSVRQTRAAVGEILSRRQAANQQARVELDPEPTLPEGTSEPTADDRREQWQALGAEGDELELLMALELPPQPFGVRHLLAAGKLTPLVRSLVGDQGDILDALEDFDFDPDSGDSQEEVWPRLRWHLEGLYPDPIYVEHVTAVAP